MYLTRHYLFCWKKMESQKLDPLPSPLPRWHIQHIKYIRRKVHAATADGWMGFGFVFFYVCTYVLCRTPTGMAPAFYIYILLPVVLIVLILPVFHHVVSYRISKEFLLLIFRFFFLDVVCALCGVYCFFLITGQPMCWFSFWFRTFQQDPFPLCKRRSQLPAIVQQKKQIAVAVWFGECKKKK